MVLSQTEVQFWLKPIPTPHSVQAISISVAIRGDYSIISQVTELVNPTESVILGFFVFLWIYFAVE